MALFVGVDPAVIVAIGADSQSTTRPFDATAYRAINVSRAISNEADALTDDAQPIAPFSRIKDAIRGW